MIDIDPMAILRAIVDGAYISLQLIVPVWLSIRFRYWSLLIIVPFLFFLRADWLRAIQTLDLHNDTNFTIAIWGITGLPTCLIIAIVIYCLTTLIAFIVTKIQVLTNVCRILSPRWLKIIGVIYVIGALTLIESMAFSISLSSKINVLYNGPAFQGIDTTLFSGDPPLFAGKIRNWSDYGMRNIVMVFDIMDGNTVMEQIIVQRDVCAAREEWELTAPIQNRHILEKFKNNVSDLKYRIRITAERGRLGCVRFVFNREWAPGMHQYE